MSTLPNLRLCAALSLACCCISAALWAQPSNDNCANAALIPVNGVALTTSNLNATNAGVNPSCGGSNIQDIWFRFVYPGGTLTIATALGTNTDTRIALWTACGGTQIACDDDSGPGNASLLTLSCTQLVAGTTYWLQAGGFNALEGTFTLTLSASLTGCTNPLASNYNPCATIANDCSCNIVPENDECASATPIVIDGPPVCVNNTFASGYGTNPSCGNSGTQSMRDVWFSFVYAGGSIQIDAIVGTLTDTRLALYDECDGTQLACNDDAGGTLASSILMDCGSLVLGHTYLIRAGGYSSLTGTFSLEVQNLGGCLPGLTCTLPFNAVIGSQVAPFADAWYVFVPDQPGQWKISTCGLASCDTGIWIYDYCNMANFDDTNEATLTYNDDFCGVQSEVTPLLSAGETYYIRIGDTGTQCGPAPIPFVIEYLGPWAGCMDVSACNFDPVATLPAACFYGNHPNCDGIGPDLEVLGNVLLNSLITSTINVTDGCMVNEGCAQGFGTRQVLRFTTHIKNIGNQDYFIGAPSASNDQFEWDECHNHYHYEGYAEYRMYDSGGNMMPQLGFKNGFCVLDLECSGGGVAKFSCGNMGITAGCGDYYSSSLTCQWVDITDVPDGDYYLVVLTNWDQSPDQAGRYEQRYDNNFAHVCVHLERDGAGNLINFSKNNTCPVPEDCIGFPFGTNVPDCLGNCPGMVKRADLNSDLLLDEEDVHEYLHASVEEGVSATTCNDLNEDGIVSVADAYYLENCIHAQEDLGVLPQDIDACAWDPQITNAAHTTELGILSVNTEEGYADVYMVNDEIEIKALQFSVSGIAVSSVESLIDMMTFDAEIAHENGRVAALAHGETFLPKFTEPTAVFRLHYSAYLAPEVCIAAIEDAINLQGHNTLTQVGDCAEVLIDFAAFSAGSTSVCQGDNVQFTDLSTEGANSWYWTFAGGSPATSNAQHPSVAFSAPGVYTITLEASNGILTDAEIKTAHITVNEATSWYTDADADGYGAAGTAAVMSCLQPAGAVANAADCNDTDGATYPGAPGQQDGVDRNCNGLIDAQEALPNTCSGDINGDNAVNTSDLLILLGVFGCTSNCGLADLSGDGAVNTGDLLVFLAAYGMLCP